MEGGVFGRGGDYVGDSLGKGSLNHQVAFLDHGRPVQQSRGGVFGLFGLHGGANIVPVGKGPDKRR